MRGGGAEREALSHGGAGPERAAMLSRSFTLCGVCCAQLLARFSVRGSPLPARPGGVCCGRAVGFCCWGCRCSPPAGAFPCPARWAPSALPLSHRRFPAIALGSAYPHSEMCACVTRLALLCSARAAPQLKPQNVFLFYPVSEQ